MSDPGPKVPDPNPPREPPGRDVPPPPYRDPTLPPSHDPPPGPYHDPVEPPLRDPPPRPYRDPEQPPQQDPPVREPDRPLNMDGIRRRPRDRAGAGCASMESRPKRPLLL